MSCIVCENILENNHTNYCGCEKCGMCGEDFCNHDCIQECVCCGTETFQTDYCGCEKCGMCGKDFCNFSCIQECVCCGIETFESNYCGCEDCSNCGKTFCGHECMDIIIDDSNSVRSENPEDSEGENN